MAKPTRAAAMMNPRKAKAIDAVPVDCCNKTLPCTSESCSFFL
jgi:hypothetical protein